MWLVYGYSNLVQCLALHAAFRKEKKSELTLIKLAIQCVLLKMDCIFKEHVLTFGTTEQCLQGSSCH